MNSSINDRIHVILSHYGLTISAFADRIGVQRSNMSHILSGRNRPSLDFVTKVIQNFTDVNLYWLLYGEGNFPNVSGKTSSPTLNFPENPMDEEESKNESRATVSKEISKIVFFYTDGTFEAFETKKG